MQIPGMSQRRIIGLVVAGLIALATWLLQGPGSTVGDADRPAQPGQAPSASATSAYDDDAQPTGGQPTGGQPTGGQPTGGADPESGLPWVSLDELPPEAAQTVELIEDGGPFPYDRDGVVFENREDLLPDHPEGYYHEYTVETPGSDDRGARRVVTGSAGEYYWTGDHYASFERIQR